MTSSSFDHSELYTFEALHDRAVTLTPDQIDQARLDSQTAPDAWQDYCDRLAHFGLVNWLTENNLLAGQAESAQESVQDLQVRDFTVRSYFVSASEEEFVTLSRSAAQSALSNPAHFYVLATVAEEQGEVWVSGFLNHAQMKTQLADGIRNQTSIELPIEVFNPKLETLCLALRTLEAVPFEASAKASQVMDPIVNLRTWLSRQWDQTLDLLDGWQPLEELREASALRGDSVGTLPQILQSLARKGIRLADSTQGLAKILPIGPIPLRLYVVPGDANNQQEWEMLVVLESATPEPMPSGLMLRIRDDEQVLLEQTFDPQTTTDRSLFAEVVSGLDESVFVDIILPNGKVHSLPKFVFQDI
jgi:hypothetical protein